jgi:hypothetical protein
MSYVKLVGTVNRHTDWTTEIILEKDDDGNPTKVIRAGEPVDLSKEEQDKLEDSGYRFESSSKAEATEADEDTTEVGADVASAGPLFGGSEQPNQQSESRERGKGTDK